jgi:hypothetical protein
MADISKPPEFAAPVPATKAREPKHSRVPRKVKEAIDAIAWGRAKTKKEGAEKFGKISREYFSRSFKNPAVVEYANQAAARAVAMGRPRAAAVLNELHDSRSERVRLEAAKASLGAIVAPAHQSQVNVNVELRAGWVIDLSEDAIPAKVVGPVIDVPAEPIAGIGPSGQVIGAKPAAE